MGEIIPRSCVGPRRVPEPEMRRETSGGRWAERAANGAHGGGRAAIRQETSRPQLQNDLTQPQPQHVCVSVCV